jgi:hypothetical protein
MGKRDEMFRAKVLIFMIPLGLPIGQPPADAKTAPALSAHAAVETPATDESATNPWQVPAVSP